MIIRCGSNDHRMWIEWRSHVDRMRIIRSLHVDNMWGCMCFYMKKIRILLAGSFLISTSPDVEIDNLTELSGSGV